MCSLTPDIVHVIDKIALGGAERQLLEITTRSRLAHTVIELEPEGRLSRGKALTRLSREFARARGSGIVAWLERSQIAVATVAAGRRPLVACIRGVPGLRRDRFGQWVLRVALARYDCFVTNSDYLRNAASEFARPVRLEPFHVIPNGVDDQAVVPVPQRRHGALRIGFIGRAPDPDKGLDVLVQALDMFREDEVEAVLVGPGIPETMHAWGQRRHRTASGVEDPWQTMGMIDLLVVPSRTEGSPNVVLEAFARGVPVIGTSVGGTVELLSGRRGYTVPSEDAPALVAAVRHVKREPDDAARRADVARSYALHAHCWPRIIAAYDNFFLDLADRPSRKRLVDLRFSEQPRCAE